MELPRQVRSQMEFGNEGAGRELRAVAAVPDRRVFRASRRLCRICSRWLRPVRGPVPPVTVPLGPTPAGVAHAGIPPGCRSVLRIPVVSLADSLNHRLQILYPFGIKTAARRTL
jgi:hypothetical protein